MAEENERRPAVERAGIAGNLPATLQQGRDCDGLFGRGADVSGKATIALLAMRTLQRTTNFGISGRLFS